MSKELLAQLDAAKQMYNDMSNTCLAVRTNINVLNVNLQEANQKIAELTAEIEKLKLPKLEENVDI